MVKYYSPPVRKPSSHSIQVTVEGLDAFGQGITTYKGKKIFIKSALPNEVVDVKLTDDKKNYAKATVIKFHQQSPLRLKPDCQHYDSCGGCELQHIEPKLQQTTKYQALVNLLQKETSNSLDNELIENAFIIADKPYQYRRRARLSLHYSNNQLKMGFRQSESNSITSICNCPVLVPELNALLKPLYTQLTKFKQKKTLGHVELISVESGVIVLLRHIYPLNHADKNLLIQFAHEHQVSLYIQGNELEHLAGTDEHYYYLNELKLTFSPLNFIQVNKNINQKMVTQALEWLTLKTTDKVLDLFCGMGNFSLPIAKLCQQVVGVEGVDALVEKAKRNVDINKQSLCAETDFFAYNLDDIQLVKQLSHLTFNKVLLDPARAGAFNVIREIIKKSPEKIVYVSCNPATLARDSKQLIMAGYKIMRMAILDMFPQTKHIESMLLFMKPGS